MFNKGIIFLFLALLFIQAINAVVMSKEEVLNIDPKKTDDKCPEASYGETQGICGYIFYCKGDLCNSANNHDSTITGIDFPDENGNLKRYKIIGSCGSNSDCLSNSCIKNECVNTNNIVYECLINRNVQKMHCGKMALESCTTDDECSSNKCSDSKVCLSEFHDEIVKIGKIALIVIASAAALLILCCCALCYCCCMRNKKNFISSLL